MASRSLPRIAAGARFQPHRVETAAAETVASVDIPAVVKPTWPAMLKPRWLEDMLVPEKNSFGVLRLAMALAVLISHCVFLSTGLSSAEPLYKWTGYTLGQHGVQVFFFLSGILVAQSLYTSQSVKDYAIARGLRIFPALIVCVLLTSVVLGPWLSSLSAMDYLRDGGVASYIVKTISLMTGSATLPGVFENAPGAAKGVVNSSLWTLKYEVLCYILLAAVGVVAIRTQLWRETALLAIAGWLMIVLYRRASIEIGSQKSAFDVMRYFMLFFGAGVVAFTLRRWLPVHGLLLVPLGAGFATAIGTRYLEPATAVFLGYGALWLATFKFGSLRDYTNKNDYSYGTYIYGLPVSQALLHFWPQMPVFSLTAITIGIVLVLAFLSWEIIERPALMLRKRWSIRAETQSVTTLAVASTDLSAQAQNIVRAAAVAVTPTLRTSELAAAATAPAQMPTPASLQRWEPGVAKPWRPASLNVKLRVAVETSNAVEATAGAPADSGKSATLTNPSPLQQVVSPPSVSKTRLHLALKRPATPSAANLPTESENSTNAPPPRISSRPTWRPIIQPSH
jgi:peptidoglycan/LPS O-acetylase OafA/YrhL